MSPELELMKVIIFFACFKFSVCSSSNEINIEYKLFKNYQFFPRSWQNKAIIDGLGKRT